MEQLAGVPLFLAVDIGTGSVRAAVFDAKGPKSTFLWLSESCH
jgi:hypothetical protein